MCIRDSLLTYLDFGYLGWQPSSQSLSMIGKMSVWCERVTGGIFREPANTLSNICFMISGLVMLRVLSSEKSSVNSFFGINKISCLYALVVIYLGPGSWLMHGTHTAWGAWADNQSMLSKGIHAPEDLQESVLQFVIEKMRLEGISIEKYEKVV